jgi:hypothetical protein
MPCSPRRRIPLASVAGELAARIARLSFANLRRLDTSHGCQDHTVLPYATAPSILRARDRSRENPPCDPHHAPGAFASTAARPNVRDDRDTPLLRAGMARVLGLIWVSREADSFFPQDWTGQISLKGLRNFLFKRSGCRTLTPHGEAACSAVAGRCRPPPLHLGLHPSRRIALRCSSG